MIQIGDPIRFECEGVGCAHTKLIPFNPVEDHPTTASRFEGGPCLVFWCPDCEWGMWFRAKGDRR